MMPRGLGYWIFFLTGITFYYAFWLKIAKPKIKNTPVKETENQVINNYIVSERNINKLDTVKENIKHLQDTAFVNGETVLLNK